MTKEQGLVLCVELGIIAFVFVIGLFRGGPRVG